MGSKDSTGTEQKDLSSASVSSDHSRDKRKQKEEEEDEECPPKDEGLSWWQPWSYLALSVNEALWSVGQWAWAKSQASTRSLLVSVQERTSGAYDSIKSRSNSTVHETKESTDNFYEDLHKRMRVRYMGAFDRIVSGYERCKQNINLAVIQTKLRLQLATNRLRLRSETAKADTKQKWSDRFNENVKRPLGNVGDKIVSVRNHTQNQVVKCKATIAHTFQGNIDTITLKAKEYEDNIEDKFPTLSEKLSRKFKPSAPQVYVSY